MIPSLQCVHADAVTSRYLGKRLTWLDMRNYDFVHFGSAPRRGQLKILHSLKSAEPTSRVHFGNGIQPTMSLKPEVRTHVFPVRQFIRNVSRAANPEVNTKTLLHAYRMYPVDPARASSAKLLRHFVSSLTDLHSLCIGPIETSTPLQGRLPNRKSTLSRLWCGLVDSGSNRLRRCRTG